MSQTPLNGFGLTLELNLGLKKSGKSQGISYCLESGNPVNSRSCLWYGFVVAVEGKRELLSCYPPRQQLSNGLIDLPGARGFIRKFDNDYGVICIC